MTFRVSLPDDPDQPLKEEDKHHTEKILSTPVLRNAPEDEEVSLEELSNMTLEEVFSGSITNLITIVEEVNPPEKTKVIGKLRGALELFNQK